MKVKRIEGVQKSKKTKFTIRDLFKPWPHEDKLPYFSGNPLEEGAIKQIWRIILSYLTPYELLLSRYWSKAFRDLHLQPMTIILRRIVRALGYDIPFKMLEATEFKVQADDDYSLQKVKEFIHLLESFRMGSVLANQRSGTITGEAYQIFDFIGIKRKNFNINTLHSLLISVFIDAMYNETKAFLKGWSVSRKGRALVFLNDIKQRTDLTQDQKYRLNQVETATLTSPDHIVDTQPLAPQRHDHYVCLNEQQIQEAHKIGLRISQYLEPMLSRSNPSTFVPINMQPRGVNAKKHPVVAEALRRSLNAPSFSEQLRLYFESPTMHDYLSIDTVSEYVPDIPSFIPKRVGLAPLWLRRRLFVDPPLLREAQVECLAKFPLKELPSEVLNADMSQQQLKEKHLFLELHFHFIPLGMKEQTIEDIIATKHSAETLYRLASIGNITYHFSDLKAALKNIKPAQFQRFFESKLWVELERLAVKNLRFIAWCALNIDYLENIYSEDREFFLRNLNVLLELKPFDQRVDISPKYLMPKVSSTVGRDGNGTYIPVSEPKPEEHYSSSFIRKSFFSLIDILFAAFRYHRIGMPPNELCEMIFNPISDILSKICQRNYLELYAAVSSEDDARKVSMAKVMKHFVSYYDRPTMFLNFMEVEHQTLVQMVKAKKGQSRYKGKTSREWLCSPTHEQVLRKYLTYVGKKQSIRPFISNVYDNYPVGFSLVLTPEQCIAFSSDPLRDYDQSVFSRLEVWVKNEMLHNAEACEKDLDARLPNVQSKPHDPRRLALMLDINHSKTLGNMTADAFFQKYEEAIILLLENTSILLEVNDLLEVLEALIKNDCFSNLEYICLLIKEFGVQMLIKLGKAKIEQNPMSLSLLQFLMMAASLEKLRFAVTTIRYQSLKEVKHADQYILENLNFLAALLNVDLLLVRGEAPEAAQKKLKLAYESSYNAVGFFSEPAPPDVEFEPMQQPSEFPDLMEEDIYAFSSESWPG